MGFDLATWLYAMHQLAQRGEQDAAETLIETYRERPEYLDRLTAAAHVAEQAWLDMLTPLGDSTQALARQVVEREVVRLQAELMAGSTDPLERLLIARIAVAWLAAQHAEKLLADGLATAGMAWTQIEQRARHAERMGRHLLRAIEALARIRRLRVGTVQVNIADKQINVAQ